MRVPTTIFGDVEVSGGCIRLRKLRLIQESKINIPVLVTWKGKSIHVPVQSLLLDDVQFDGGYDFRIRMTQGEYAASIHWKEAMQKELSN